MKISFLQDVYTIIEELSGDCPGVGLPQGFNIDKSYYELFRTLQKKYELTKIFLNNPERVKSLEEWRQIKPLIEKYRNFWLKNKYKLLRTLKTLEAPIDLNWFVNSLSKVTRQEWNTPEVKVFLTLGYKDSGTYDRDHNLIRIGIHENKEEYLLYTLYHELIHYHIVNHMKLKLTPKDEETLCRAIFNILFKEDLIAQRHWRENLSQEEIKKIEEKSKEIQCLL